MIVFKIYNTEKFEELHTEYFNQLLETIKAGDYLSSSIDEIIITDDFTAEIERYSKNRFRNPNITQDREFQAIAKTVDFNGKKKIFFDATKVSAVYNNTPYLFIAQLVEVYAEDIISIDYSVTNQFLANTPIIDIVKIYFSQWATKTVSSRTLSKLNIPHDIIYADVKMFVDAFKRNIRKMHYSYQSNQDLGEFWINVISEVDSLIRRCLDVKHENGNLVELQEFSKAIPPLLIEIEKQTKNLLDKNDIQFHELKKYVLEIINICFIEIQDEERMIIKVVETPKKLFRNNLIDTEPRIVAFIDILGFSNIIKEYDSDDLSNILNELHETLDMAVKVSIENMKNPEIKTDINEYLEYRMFSDCICLSLPYIEFGNDFHVQFHSLATIVKSYQLAMMQKGFFVRGGISIGSFFADKHMIFSGGLVSAYKLEQITGHPVIAIDKNVIERLNKNFSKNSTDLFLDKILVFSKDDPNKIFLNPFDLLDNSKKHFDYLQSTMDNLIKESKEDSDESVSSLTTSLLELTNSFTKPVFEFAKSQITPENINLSKEEILKHINEQTDRQYLKLAKIEFSRNKGSNNLYNKIKLILLKRKPDTKEVTEIKRIISKYVFLETLIKWSMEKVDSTIFKFYNFYD